MTLREALQEMAATGNDIINGAAQGVFDLWNMLMELPMQYVVIGVAVIIFIFWVFIGVQKLDAYYDKREDKDK